MNDKKKITIYDLAEITGFSVGTVNRALNGKDRIKEETRRLILETADRVGYKANPAAQGLHRNQMRIGVILYCSVAEYVNDIHRGISVAAQDIEKYNVAVDIYQIPYTTNLECRERTVELLRDFMEKKYNGVVLYSSSTKADMTEISQMIDEVSESGIPVATVANDIPESRRIFHVGVNAFVAGRMAAEMLCLSCAGKDVALLTNSMESEVNRQYVEGFYDFAGEKRFSSIRVYSHYDEHDLVLQQTERMIAENKNLAGVYMTSASATIACQHIRALGRKDYRIITTDLLEETPRILSDGIAFATIFQDPYRQGKTALRNLYDYLVSRRVEGNNVILPSIVLSSNASLYRNW